MDLIHHFPQFALRHKIITLLCNLKIQDRYIVCNFNNSSSAIIDLLDPEPRNTFITGTFEPFFFKIALAFLPNNGVFFDLGANTGFCSFGLVQQKPNVHYHMFEANVGLVTQIAKSVRLPQNENTQFFNNHCCLAQHEGFSYFNIDPNQAGQSHTSTHDQLGIRIQNMLLDHYCVQNDISEVDFAKIDIEGQEYPAILGWEKFLKHKRVKSLLMESFPRNVQKYGIDIRSPLKFLENRGYQLFLCKKQDFASFAEQPSPESFPFGNLLVAKFKAREYPVDFSTEVLAVCN